ncbi:MAG: addiction module protein [bacterium]
MTTLAKKYLDEAMHLSLEDRAELVDKLLISLNSSTQNEIDDLWKIEVEKRVEAYNRGDVNTIEGKAVFNEIKLRLSK